MITWLARATTTCLQTEIPYNTNIHGSVVLNSQTFLAANNTATTTKENTHTHTHTLQTIRKWDQAVHECSYLKSYLPVNKILYTPQTGTLHCQHLYRHWPNSSPAVWQLHHCLQTDHSSEYGYQNRLHPHFLTLTEIKSATGPLPKGLWSFVLH